MEARGAESQNLARGLNERQVRTTQVEISTNPRLLGRHPGRVVATESNRFSMSALDIAFIFNRGLMSHISSLGYKYTMLQVHLKRKQQL